MCNARKDLMRCSQTALPCNSCPIDCKRAEVQAKDDRVKADLLAACKAILPVVPSKYCKAIKAAIAKATE